MSWAGRIWYCLFVGLFFGLLIWWVRPLKGADSVDLAILKGQPYEESKIQWNYNTSSESRTYELNCSPEEAYASLRGQLNSAGWIEREPVPRYKRTKTTKVVIGFTHDFEHVTDAREIYVGVGPSIRRKDATKADAYLTVLNHRIAPFWERR